MSCNVIWPLLTFVLTFVLTSNNGTSAIAAVLVMVIIGFIGFALQFRRWLKRKQPIDITKPLLNSLLATVLVFTVPILIGGSKLTIVQNYYRNQQLVAAYQRVPTPLLKQAVTELKAHKNNYEYCALLFYPSLDENKPAAIAKYLAYYRYESEYCPNTWQFGKDHCAYLEGISRNTGVYTPIKNLVLCHIAQGEEYSKKIGYKPRRTADAAE